jgi:Tol biopolymer transport system component
MKRLLVVAAMALAIGGVHAGAQQNRSSIERRFASAEHKANVEGDLKAAIEEYKQIVAAAGSDRSAAARALLRMAEAYQRLGDTEARRIYERLVRDYQDQSDAVSEARARLSPIENAKVATLRTERVLELGRPHDRISPDERVIARPNSETGNLELVDVRTGIARAVTSDGTNKDPGHLFPLASTFSRDGRQIAYQWFIEDENRSVLRVVSTTQAPGPPRMLYDNRDVDFAPTDWSPDGKWIAGVARRADRTAQLALVGIDGSFRAIKTVEWSRVGGARFAPDSSRLAFHVPAVDGGFTRDVYVITLGDAPKQTLVASSAGDDTLLEWATDGRSLLIASDRGGNVSVWRVPADGRSGGSQFELVKSDTGVMSSLGPTTTGTIYYNHQPSKSGVMVAQFDAATGQLSSPPRTPLTQFRGVTGTAQWSADGRFLVYESFRDIPAPINVTRPVVTFASAETGEPIRELNPAIAYGGMGILLADNKTFVVRGSDLKGRGSFVKVDAATGAATVIVENDTCSGVGARGPDDRSFFCFDFEKRQILQVDLDGRILRNYSSDSQGVGMSPDGRYLACTGPRLPLISLATGEKRDLLKSPEMLAFRAWTPDSRNVIAYGRVNGQEALWSIPLEGGAPRRIAVEASNGVASWQFQPKTGQVVFTTGGGRWQLEVWKLENYQPKATIPSSQTYRENR